MKIILDKIATIAAILMLTIFGMNIVKADQLTDAQILGIYNQVNSIDIETALLGQVSGHSEEVRKLAKMVADDHTGVRKAAQDLANELKLTPLLPKERNLAAQSHYAVIEKLRKLSGEEFDKAYLLHEIKFHTEALNAVKKVLLPNTKNAKIKEHFETVLPHFQHHLNETRKTAKKLNILK